MSKRPKALLKRKDVNEKYGFSTSFLEKHNEIPRYQIGRSILYDQDELDEWIASHRVEPSKNEILKVVDEVVDRIINKKEE